MNSHDLLFNFYLGINLKAILHTHEYICVCVYPTATHPFLILFSFLPSAPESYPLSSCFQKLGLKDLKSGKYFKPSLVTHFSVGNTFHSSPSIFLVHFHTHFLNGKSLYHMDQIHYGKPISQIIVHCIFNKP